MIKFHLDKHIEPINYIHELYKLSTKNGNKAIEVFALSTCSPSMKPSVRYVNIKYINNDNFIFFSNYNSPKAQDINLNPYVAGVFYWKNIGIQIRIEGKIEKTSIRFSDAHFNKRSNDKNLLAITSNQSCEVSSYQSFLKRYDKTKKSFEDKILERPSYWGGYSINASKIEIWRANKSRLNERNLYFKYKDIWNHSVLEP